MRTKGTLRSWNDEKGFGFISTSDGSKDVFLHISAFSNRNRRPEVGQLVTYAFSADSQGRPRATKATLPGDKPSRPRKKRGTAWAGLITGGFLAVLLFSVFSSKIPALVLWAYLALSLVTFLVYAFDKAAAKKGAWRTSESILHWLSLAGGWPGALIAQQVLRHKSRKQSFRAVFWVTVIINCGLLAWMYTPAGAEFLQSFFAQLGMHFNFGQAATIEWAD